MRRPGEAVSRFDLLECAWDDSYDNRSNIVDVYIGYLRQKVDRPFGADNIETVRGFGYRLCDRGKRMSRLPIRWRLTLAFAPH